MRFIAAGSTGLAIVAALPGAVSAKTLQVDDDRAQCRSAPFTAIQPAVNAAAAGDVISVCRGTYSEQIVMPEGKDNLQLRAVAKLQATLRQPNAGITVGTDEPDGDGNPTAVLVTRGRNTLVLGFRIIGPTSYANPDACGGSIDQRAAVAVPEGTATLDSNHITSASIQCPGRDSEPFGEAVFTGEGDGFNFACCAPITLKMDRNQISGRSGISSFGRSHTTIQRNTMTGTGASNSNGFVTNDGEAGADPEPSFTDTLRDNDISGYAEGITMFSDGRPLAIGNRLRNNGVGISIDGSIGGDLRGNSITDGGTGIRLGGSSDDAFSYLVRNNQVRNNSGDGIQVSAGSANNQLFDNTSLGNGDLDCRDESTGTRTAGTANTWVRNIGVTDSPDVCRAP